MEDYIEAKDLKDLNFNIKLLIQKVNHEQTNMNKEIKTNVKTIGIIKKDVNFLKNGFNEFVLLSKGMSLMLKIILGIIGAIGSLIGIGVALG